MSRITFITPYDVWTDGDTPLGWYYEERLRRIKRSLVNSDFTEPKPDHENRRTQRQERRDE